VGLTAEPGEVTHAAALRARQEHLDGKVVMWMEAISDEQYRR
jgi:hypothetical protein